MKRILMSLTLAIFVGTMALCVFAQQMPNDQNAPQGEVRKEIRIERSGNVGTQVLMPGRGDGNSTFVYSEMSFNGKPVKGAPYSAQATSESTQTLADGNRIVRTTKSNIYRDSEGRTRHDQTLNAVGPYAVAGETPQIISIHDPVAGVTYVLNSRDKTARKMPTMHFEFSGKPGERIETRSNVVIVEQNNKKSGEKDAHSPLPPPPPGAPLPMGDPREFILRSHAGKDDQAKVESLGTQTIEGVQAEGKRITHTIPAGAIGNEQPINIVDERWYSNELQTVVLSKHSDPRFGETNYRLTNINRSEPAASLFQVPPDYTVKEFSGNVRRMHVQKPSEKQ